MLWERGFGGNLLLRRLKVDADGGRDFDGVAFDQEGTVAPRSYCVGSRATQKSVALDDVHVLDRSVS